MSRRLLLNADLTTGAFPHLFEVQDLPQSLLDKSPHLIDVTGDLEYEALYYDDLDAQQGFHVPNDRLSLGDLI